MDFAAYKKPRQREYVIIALDHALRSISSPAPTIEIVEMVRRSLAANADQKVSIGRILGQLAPHVPEAQRGEAFKAYGRTMQRWIWHPKGMLPGGEATRQAAREVQMSPEDRRAWIDAEENGWSA
jgi:hypothetical protein